MRVCEGLFKVIHVIIYFKPENIRFEICDLDQVGTQYFSYRNTQLKIFNSKIYGTISMSFKLHKFLNKQLLLKQHIKIMDNLLKILKNLIIEVEFV